MVFYTSESMTALNISLCTIKWINVYMYAYKDKHYKYT